MNPYEVLGVSPDDDEETVKKAYRSLVKKYHPDRYANSPLAEQANEKLKEINLAYDIICGKAQASEQPPRHNGGGYSAQNVSFESVRVLISMMQLSAAEQMLDALPRTAQWYYLKGIIYTRRGHYSGARQFFETACRMEPENDEYRSALAGFGRNAADYRTYSAGISPTACCMAGVCCSSLFCRSCCCYC